MKRIPLLALLLSTLVVSGCTSALSTSVDSVDLVVSTFISSDSISSDSFDSSTIVDVNYYSGEHLTYLETTYDGALFVVSTVDLTPYSEVIAQIITVIQEDEVISYIYELMAEGYKDGLCIYLIGITPEGIFDSYHVVELPLQTVGVGTQVQDADFYDQFLDQSITTPITPITGATYTSGGLISAIQIAVAHFNDTIGN